MLQKWKEKKQLMAVQLGYKELADSYFECNAVLDADERLAERLAAADAKIC